MRGREVTFQLTFSISSQSECQAAAVFLLAGVPLFALSHFIFISSRLFRLPRTRGCIPEHLVRILSHFLRRWRNSFAEISEMWKLTPTVQSVGRKYGLDESSNKQHTPRCALFNYLFGARARERCCQADQDTFTVMTRSRGNSLATTHTRREKLPASFHLRYKLRSTHIRAAKKI